MASTPLRVRHPNSRPGFPAPLPRLSRATTSGADLDLVHPGYPAPAQLPGLGPHWDIRTPDTPSPIPADPRHTPGAPCRRLPVAASRHPRPSHGASVDPTPQAPDLALARPPAAARAGIPHRPVHPVQAARSTVPPGPSPDDRHADAPPHPPDAAPPSAAPDRPGHARGPDPRVPVPPPRAPRNSRLPPARPAPAPRPDPRLQATPVARQIVPAHARPAHRPDAPDPASRHVPG